MKRAFTALGFNIILLALEFPISTESKWPPDLNVLWLVAGAAAIISFFASLSIAQTATSKAAAAVADIAALAAILGVLLPIQGYYLNFYDYPWIAVWLLVAAVVIGSIRLKRWIPLCVSAVAIVWLSLPFGSEPGAELPRTATSGPYSVTMLSLDQYKGNPRAGFSFQLTGLSESQFANCAKSLIEMDGQFGPFMPVRHAFAQALERDPKSPSPSASHSFRGNMLVRSWMRAIDVTIRVPISTVAAGSPIYYLFRFHSVPITRVSDVDTD